MTQPILLTLGDYAEETVETLLQNPFDGNFASRVILSAQQRLVLSRIPLAAQESFWEEVAHQFIERREAAQADSEDQARPHAVDLVPALVAAFAVDAPFPSSLLPNTELLQ